MDQALGPDFLLLLVIGGCTTVSWWYGFCVTSSVTVSGDTSPVTNPAFQFYLRPLLMEIRLICMEVGAPSSYYKKLL